MPLFLMIGIDGHSQVIAVYLTCTETAAALTHVVSIFISFASFSIIYKKKLTITTKVVQ